MNDEKHYVTLNNYLKHRFGCKVFRIPLNANFSCPNRDSSIDHTGCLYCSKSLSGDFAGKKELSFEEQFKDIKQVMEKKWHDGLYIAYLQAGTNTYADIETLRKIYNEVIELDSKIVVLSIATRPDCINEEIIALLKEIKLKKELWIELGFQTMHDDTKDYLHIGYHNQDFEKAMKLLNDNNIPVIVHIINGLPQETKEMMIETVKYLNNFVIDGIKIHMLHILKDTPLADIYEKDKFKVLTKDEFIDIAVEQLRLLNPNTVVHRITGDPVKEDLIEPLWVLKKFVVLNDIDKLMRKEKYYQGDLWQK
ncbi:MAG: TIGR01212 family radical SAM protein [Bacilli bacterium]|nr:TIGR01212 family radical SAM protein [Bacilli bacterium]